MKNKTYNTDHFYCLILAGGKGRRLWPVSQQEKPKQFIDFFGTGKSLLQQTYERFCNILPEDHIYVSTFAEYSSMVRAQLPQLPARRLLCEPVRRNTTPIAAWATHRIENIDPSATLVITPSDQFITDEAAFRDDMLQAMHHASEEKCFLTMGIRPTRPEPGYGYLQLGDVCDPSADEPSIFKVNTFIEKPEREFAEMFIKSREFLWNTGLFISTVATIHNRLASVLPDVLRQLDSTFPEKSVEAEERWINDHYATYPNISLETAFLDRTDGVAVKLCHFGWADIGSWHGIYEAFALNSDDNVVLKNENMLSDTTGCVISLPDGKTAIINGLHNFIVAEHDNILLITPRNDSSNQVIRMLTNFEIDQGRQ